MELKRNIFVVSGPSGVGKGTICAELVKHNPDMFLSVSVTSREPREGEIDGVHYHFKTPEEMQKMIDNDELLEYAQYVSSSYGTPKAPCIENLEKGKDVILEIEVQGGMQVKSKFPKAILIFVVPPDMEELENRLKGRGTEEEDVIKKRIKRAYEELELMDNYDYIVVNDKVSNAENNIKSIITAERYKKENTINNIKKELKL